MQNHDFDTYPNILLVLLFFKLILLDTSGCERGFSTMNRIKDKARTRLRDENLMPLMTINILGPDILKEGNGQETNWELIDVLLHNAIILWKKSANRSLGAFVGTGT